MSVPAMIVEEVASINSGYKKNGSEFRINTKWNPKTSEVSLTLMHGKNTVYVQNKKYTGMVDGEDRQIMEDFMVGATMGLSIKALKKDLPK